MKKTSLIILLLCFAFISRAQNVVEWEIRCKKISGKTYEVHFTPQVQSPWHIYSLESAEGMGIPTSFSFDKNPYIILEGNVKDIGMQQDFVQKIKLKKDTTVFFSGRIKFMACTDEQCLPPKTKEFKCKVGGK